MDFMKSKKLKELLNSGETLVVPDAYDPISAKLIENAGFKAVQCSGYSFSISAGYKREIDVTLDENIELTRRIVESVDVPVMADAEDGFGGPEVVIDTVERYLEVGVAGLNIEDQIPDGKSKLSIIDADLMAQKIMVARETAEIEGYHDFIINGRTDALKSTDDRSEGLDLAIDRANQYLEVGADLAFVTYASTLDEVKQIVKGVKGPVSIAAGQPYNINNFTIDDLRKLGVARVSLPTLLIYSSLQAINNSLHYLKEDNLVDALEHLYGPVQLNELLNK
ncbi:MULTISPECIES: isocitrate lyase/PEP mutase family protein [Methanobacterium]|uniref:Isocitrate lyase/PEP mutase family protein n=1 Tax=Methanobacterium veterum TaxID=408577 RepID=A0A9E4ZYL6_9EURY|nr:MULTISPECIES: isocitrate lyase/PEP mutase family protein [Methanobacterium]MCZ3365978.1 isocitrate lyase/PEP mutase family protein [Methanobacterium veterum]MCZ3371443.1 isocitrate lyase/PEP mutase family protein [Methanobacterium veterum]